MSRTSRDEGTILTAEEVRLYRRREKSILEQVISYNQRNTNFTKVWHIEHTLAPERCECHNDDVELSIIQGLQLTEVVIPLSTTIHCWIYPWRIDSLTTAQNSYLQLGKSVQKIKPAVERVDRAKEQHRTTETIRLEEMMNDTCSDSLVSRLWVRDDMGHLIIVQRLQHLENHLVLEKMQWELQTS